MAHIGNFYATVQIEDFYLGTRTKALISKQNISVYCLLFLTTIINRQSYLFSYGRVGSDKIPELLISLPIKDDGSPDWYFMESYIKSLPFSDIIPSSVSH